MKAQLLDDRRVALADDAFADIRIWRVPRAVSGSRHSYKYSLAYVVSGECVLRYDNERGKGDHKHIDGKEHPYEFSDTDTLIDDFFGDIARMMP